MVTFLSIENQIKPINKRITTIFFIRNGLDTKYKVKSLVEQNLFI